RSYPAVPESVPSMRSALSDFAASVGAKADRLEAIRLAASEAVTNGVLHAYNGPRGTIQVTASFVGGEFWLFIADDGTGLRPRGPRSEEHTSELQSQSNLVCRLLLEKKND